MLCQNCNQYPATLHYTKIVNGKKTQMNLCQFCAKENADLSYDYSNSINSFLASFFEIPLSYSINNANNTDKCSNCGLTIEEFANTGKFGCSKCYKTFDNKLCPIIKRLHGSIQHNGKHPRRIRGKAKVKSEMEELKNRLNSAVKQEKYELAAQLRDKIKELETSSDIIKE